MLDKLRRNSPTLTESLNTTVLEDTLDLLFPKKKKEKERIDMADQWRNEYDITIQEIFHIVKKRLKRHTAPGVDGVKAVYLKYINSDMMEHLAKGFTICLKN